MQKMAKKCAILPLIKHVSCNEKLWRNCAD